MNDAAVSSRGPVGSRISSALRALSAAAFLTILSGCTGLTPQQLQLLREGREAYNREQFATSASKLSELLDQARPQLQQDKPPRELAQALYLRGSSYARLGRRTQAAADLRRCVELDADADSTWRSLVVIGTLHYEDGRWDDAQRVLGQAAERMPAGPAMQVVLYRQAVSLERIGHWAEARRVFQALVDRFPTAGNWTDAARRRLELNASGYAIQCGVFAQPRNAENLLADLRRKGWETSIRRETREGRVLHAVLVGHYATYEEALRQLEAVRKIQPQAVLWP
jgi:tetratricopeptide (TPR) repeat protein